MVRCKTGFPSLVSYLGLHGLGGNRLESLMNWSGLGSSCNGSSYNQLVGFGISFIFSGCKQLQNMV